jgi:hypothetical protein
MLHPWMTYSDLPQQEAAGAGSPVSVPELWKSGWNSGGCALQSVARWQG